MRRLPPPCWLLVLLVHLAGCTTYRAATLPRSDPADRPTPAATDRAVVLTRGMPVRIILRSGETIDSEVDNVTPHALTIGKVGNYGWETRTIPAADIAMLEVPAATTFSRVVAVATGVVLAAALALLVLIAVSNPDFSGLD